MYNTKIHDTYNRLRNGDKKLLEIMDEIVEYQVTNGRKQSQVKVYLNTEGTIMRFIAYIILVFALAVGIALIWGAVNFVSISVILTIIPSLLVFYSMYQILNLHKYLLRADDYKNVMAYVRTLDPAMLEKSYYDYINRQK